MRELFDREERDAMGHVLSRRQLVIRRGEQMTVGFDLWQPEAEELLDGPSYGRAT